MVAPDWFRQTITEGIQALVVLSLQNQPPADTIGYTLDVWVRALWGAKAWTEADRDRIAAGFAALTLLVDRWPAPKHLLAALPARPRQKELPAPTPSLSVRIGRVTKFRELLGDRLKRRAT